MKTIDSTLCRTIEPLLSEYFENDLSARQVWEVEKHLAECSDCSSLSRQMQATVEALHSVERLDTSRDFMAKLHARLDNVEQEAKKPRSISETLRELLSTAQSSAVRYRLPALSMGLACSLLTLAVVITRNKENLRLGAPAISATHSAVVQKSVSTDNPFADPVAERLAYQSDTSKSDFEKD